MYEKIVIVKLNFSNYFEVHNSHKFTFIMSAVFILFYVLLSITMF